MTSNSKTVFELATQITDASFLPGYHVNESADGKSDLKNDSREVCEHCGRSVKFFCYECYFPVGEHKDKVPKVKLPLPLTIIKHRLEKAGKSTGIHAKVLAYEDTRILEFPIAGEAFKNPEKCLLLFPSQTSKTMEELDVFCTESKENSPNHELSRKLKYEHIVVIEGTWSQAKKILRLTPQLQKMTHIRFSKEYSTVFWRFQQYDLSYLATIEAIYLIYYELMLRLEEEFKELDNIKKGIEEERKGYSIDNLLFYYLFFYKLIQKYYKDDRNSGRSFTTRHIEGYIKNED